MNTPCSLSQRALLAAATPRIANGISRTCARCGDGSELTPARYHGPLTDLRSNHAGRDRQLRGAVDVDRVARRVVDREVAHHEAGDRGSLDPGPPPCSSRPSITALLPVTR